MRVSVDVDRCCGSGQCVRQAPEVFDQREADGIVVVREPRPAPPLHDAVREAADVCPSAAITVAESSVAEGSDAEGSDAEA